MPKINPNTLRKLNLYRQNPDIVQPLTNGELADLVVVVLGQVDIIDKAIKDGRLDGVTPIAGKDYLSKEEALKMLTNAVNTKLSEFDASTKAKGSTMEAQVAQAIANIRNGDDGVVTEEDIAKAARAASELIELPDFEAMVQTEITTDGFAVRDALELLNGDDKLEQSAVKDLKEDLAKLWDEVQKKSTGNGVGGTSKPAVYRFIKDAIADGTITSGGSLPDQTGNAGKFLNTDGTDATWESIPGGGDMLAANNLSDVASASTSRSNLGLGTAATQATGAFATAAQGSKADSAQQPPSEGAFVNGDKTKLNGIAAGAEVNVQANWTATSGDAFIANKPSLATVATSGDYDDLSNKPDLSAFDNISEHANVGAFPGTGAADKFYLAQDTGILYRWTGSAYAIISAQLALGETSSTAYRGDRGKTAFDHVSATDNPHSVSKAQVGLSNVPNTNATARASHTGTQLAATISDFAATVRATVLTGLSTATSTAVVAADTILVAIGKLQAQVNLKAGIRGAVNAQTGTTYTLVIGDEYLEGVRMTNASANTITIPPNSAVAFPVGTKVFITQGGAGSTTIAAGAGVTINAPSTVTLAIDEQWESRVCQKTGTNEWLLI